MSRSRFACIAALSLIAASAGATAAQAQEASSVSGPLKDWQVRRNAGALREALSLAERALSSAESSGSSSPQVAQALVELAGLELEYGELAKADAHARRARTIVEAGGQKGKLYADAFAVNATVASVRKDTFAAEDLMRTAVEVYKQVFEDREPQLVRSASCALGYIYAQRGDFQSGEHECVWGAKKGKSEYGNRISPEDDALWSLNVAASYHGKRLKFNAAKAYQGAFSKLQEALGPEHPQTALAMSRLADFYLDMGDVGLANRLQTRALELRVKSLGPNNRWTADNLQHLAQVRIVQKDYAAAKKLYEQSLAVLEKGYGAEDIGVADACLALGALLWTRMGHDASAEPLLRRALAIREKAFGANHKLVGDVLRALADVHEARGEASLAMQEYDRAEAIYDEYVGKLVLRGSEDQRRKNADELWAFWNRLLSFQARASEPKAARMGLRTVLRNKGRVLDAMAEGMALVRAQMSAQDQASLQRMIQYRGFLAAQVIHRSRVRGTYTAEEAKGGGAEVTSAWMESLFEHVATEEENTLSRRAEQLGRGRPTTNEAIAAAIPEGSALVELIEYVAFDPKSPGEGVPHYGAFVLERSGEVRWAELGAASTIDGAVRSFRRQLASPGGDIKTIARQLDQLVMRPVRDVLNGARSVFLAPDGALNLIPFGALVDENGNYLVESMSFTYLTSGRDLLHFAASRPASRGEPMVLANPDFGTRGDAPSGTSRGEGTSIALNLSRIRFSPLPGTAEEASELGKVIPGAKVFSGAEATEDRLKQLKGPRILHIATHGFFLDGNKAASSGKRSLELDLGTDPARPPEQKDTKLNEYDPLNDPLLRSGLALSGANRMANDSSEGWLTAYEAMTLDLQGTQLVVLSACETGVGEVAPGEGVFGLRRALVVAGSETQVMSLWKVDDQATRDLMVSYYKRLQAGGGRTEALREVQLEMLSGANRSHPYYWASFIPSGDPRTFDGKPVTGKYAKPMAASRLPTVDAAKGRGCACDVAAPERAPAWGWLTFIAGAALLRARRR